MKIMELSAVGKVWLKASDDDLKLQSWLSETIIIIYY